MDPDDDSSDRTPKDVGAFVPESYVPAPLVIEQAIRTLLPGAVRKQWPAIVNGRASWETVRAWKYGKRRLPAWARDAIHANLTRHANAILEQAAQVARADIGPGHRGCPAHFHRWRMQQAEKKKARD